MGTFVVGQRQHHAPDQNFLDAGQRLHDHGWMNNNKTTIVVFWVEEGAPQAADFLGPDIGLALAHCEALRKRTASGEPVSHVCLSTDLPGNVTQPGVNGNLPDGYDWTKRRQVRVGGRAAAVAGGGAAPQACASPEPVDLALKQELARSRQ